MAEKRRLNIHKIVVYLIIFFAIWSVRELFIRPVFINQLDGLAWQAAESSMKLLVWTLPALLLIKHFQDDMWISLKEMFTNRPKWFKEAPILLLVFVPLVNPLIANGGLSVRPGFQAATLFESVVFAGITEDIVFRGFLLNAFLKKVKLLPAIALTDVLFVLIHYPIWFYRGFDLTTFLFASVQVFFIGAFLSYSFIKTKSIFVPIGLHMIWNLLVVLFAV